MIEPDLTAQVESLEKELSEAKKKTQYWMDRAHDARTMYYEMKERVTSTLATPPVQEDCETCYLVGETWQCFVHPR